MTSDYHHPTPSTSSEIGGSASVIVQERATAVSINKLAGTQKERRFSKEGGLLHRMFGGSNSGSTSDLSAPATASTTPPGSPSTATTAETAATDDAGGEKRANAPVPNKNGEVSPADKKRRSSGVGNKAAALFANAKQSLHLSSSPSGMSNPDSPVQDSAFKKLGKTDPALSVPQGANNNSAGTSQPGPRSTFRVGVTEDRNKKCRRTMEDTHAFLYNFLSTPAPVLRPDSNTDGSTPSPGSISPSASVKGGQVTETDNGYFAIFDGHAGTFAADWCGKKLHILLEEAIRSNPNAAIPELLDQTFTSVDQQLQKLPLKNSGCTAICAVLRWEDRIPNPQSATGSTAMAPVAAAVAKAATDTAENASLNIPASIAALPSSINSQTAIPKLQEQATRQRVLYTANVGDARIVLCRNGKALRLSYDHKGSDENEGRRIQNAGGMILNNRVNGVLAVTRALGDTYMKELVTGHPYTTETVIQPEIDEFLILACDGVSEALVARVDSMLTLGYSFGTSVLTKTLWTWCEPCKILNSHPRCSSSTH